MTTSPDNLTADLPLTAAAATRYQQLRGHLAILRLHTAAEQLPAVLDQASNEGLSVTAALERLLALEVDATEARRLAGRLRFACLPPRPASRTSTTTPPPAWTGSWSPNSAPAATSTAPPT